MKWTSFSIPILWDKIQIILQRFPLAILCALGFSVIAIHQIDTEADNSEVYLQRILFCLAAGVPLMIGLHACTEIYTKTLIQKFLFLFSGIVILAFIYFLIAPDFEFEHLRRPIRFLSLFLIFHLFVAITPFIKSKTLIDFWEYNKNLLIQWYIGSFYALVIFSGLAIALLAVDELFEIHINEKLYIYIFIIIAFIFHPIYFLSGYPELTSKQEEKVEWIKALKVLVNYILIPMSILYFIILYAFGLKILINWQLPHGWVSALVLGFSGVGIFSYLLNFRIADIYQNKLSVFYKKYFYFGLLPLVFLLFAAIFRRLTDYGFTPPRYFVLISGLWLLVICIYFIISKKDTIKWIPMSLILFLGIGTMSPIDAFEMTIASQSNRIRTKLEGLQLLNGQRMKPNLSALSNEDKESIQDMIREIHRIGGNDKLAEILPESISIDSLNLYSDEYTIFEKIGLIDNTSSDKSIKTHYLSFYNRNNIPITQVGWLYVIDLTDANVQDSMHLEGLHELRIVFRNHLNDTVPLKSLVEHFDLNPSELEDDKILDKPFDLKTAKYNYRFFLTNLNYKKVKNNFEIDYINGYLICSEK